MAARALIVGFCPLVFACAADTRDEPTWQRPPTASPASVSTPTPAAYVPVACDRVEWPTISAPSSASSLAVAATQTGATLFSVPTAGGDVSAFSFDPKGELFVPSQVVRTGDAYVSIGASYVGGHLVTAAVDSSGNAFVDMVANDLSTSTQIAKVPAAYASKTPMLDVWGTPTVPTLAPSELDVTTFDTSFVAQQTTAIEQTHLPVSVDAAQIGNDGVVGWSTTTDCHVEILSARGAVTSESQPFPCAQVRVAADPASYTTVAVYETAFGAKFFGAWFANVTPLERMLAPGGTAPRVAFDGTRFWVAFIAGSGELAAGFIGDDGVPQVTGLQTLPARDAFELRVVAGEPWVFTVDTAGFHGRRICVAAQ